MELLDKIDKARLPEHIAIIMDGNGRWAKERGKPRIFGHRNGVKAVRDTIEGIGESGVKNVTLYAFSTENWKRPPFEVNALMSLLVDTLRKEIKSLHENDICLKAIGDINALPDKSHKALVEAIGETRDNSNFNLILALNYSGRWDLEQAIRKMLKACASGELSETDISQDTIKNYLSTAGIPDPELLIRTSGEMRISNFLLWEIAYAELYFSPVLWPDFRKKHLFEAIIDFQSRERRFGKTGDQLVKS